MKMIDQFMWGYQPLFRSNLEHSAAKTLRQIGVNVAPVAMLIGFEEAPGGHPICVEPESFGIDPKIFATCIAEGLSIYEAHEFRNFMHGDVRSHQKFHAALLDKSRVEAIAKVMNEHVDHDLRLWFVGRSERVGRYRVYPLLGVLRDKWEALPTLTRQDYDHRSDLYLSLHEAVVQELLRSATFELSLSEEPDGFHIGDQNELIRRASSSFIRKLVFFKGNPLHTDLSAAMNKVAAQPYEGRTGVGTLLLSSSSNYALELSFNTPIDLTQTRALRKALEMTDTKLHLITDGKVALGLGRLGDHYDSESESAFFLRVVGRGSWQLMHNKVALMVVNDGQASVPRESLSRFKFDDALTRLFASDCNPERLWNLALAASHQAHGTMLVVHAEAEEEAKRLSPPAIDVAPESLTESTLLAVSAIDGAIIVDPKGRCHAVGAILDGLAVQGLGDASRGARFNSAHRYLAQAAGKCLIIIVSEDGMINLIPDLPRQVERSYVEKVLASFESYSYENPVDFENAYKSEKHLRSLEFYLTSDQCARANDALERIEKYRESSAGSYHGLGFITRVGYDPYEPNNQLDESFFLPDK